MTIQQIRAIVTHDNAHEKENKLKVQKLVSVALNVNEHRNIKNEIKLRTDFIKKTLIGSGLNCLVLGISGGVDSLATGLLCQNAVNELNKEFKTDVFKFIGVNIPYKSQKDAEYVELSLKTINPSIVEQMNIAHATDAMKDVLSPVSEKEKQNIYKKDFVIGNVKARMRMIVQYALAGIYGGLVVGTDHASEAVTGFFTKYGDGGFDFAPLSGLVKSQVVSIAKTLGAPESLYNKVPTADLEELHVNKPDEEALGVSYSDIEDYLFEKEVSDSVFDKITDYYLKTEHKRQVPLTFSE